MRSTYKKLLITIHKKKRKKMNMEPIQLPMEF